MQFETSMIILTTITLQFVVIIFVKILHFENPAVPAPVKVLYDAPLPVT
jgi:hypothetical protein